MLDTPRRSHKVKDRNKADGDIQIGYFASLS